MVAIEVNASQLRKLERALKGIANVPKALAPAINKTLSKGQTTVKREIRKQYLIKAKDIPTKVTRASTGNLSGAVSVDQGMLDLAKFKISPKGVQTRKNRRPIKAQVRVGSGGKIIAGGFVAQMGGYVGPFMRAAGAGRLPVRKLLAIGAGIMASQPTVGPAVQKAMGDALAKNIDSQISRFMAKSGGSA